MISKQNYSITFKKLPLSHGALGMRNSSRCDPDSCLDPILDESGRREAGYISETYGLCMTDSQMEILVCLVGRALISPEEKIWNK